MQNYTASIVKADKDDLAISLKTVYAADLLKFTGTFTQAGKVLPCTTNMLPLLPPHGHG